MDTIFPSATIQYRAIESATLHHLGYMTIIALEALTALVCWLGAYRLLKTVHAPAALFNKSKQTAIAGLTLGFLVWQVGFMSVGGEWFGMWMSKEWNGVADAFRFFTTIILVLIYLNQKDTENDD